MTDEFNLRRLVREILDTSSLNDPRDLSAAVLDRIRPSQYEAAIGQLLPALVREMIRDSRNNDTPMPPLGRRGQPGNAVQSRMLKSVGAPVSTGTVANSDSGTVRTAPLVMAELPSGQPPRAAFRSAKVAAYQQLGAKWLEERLCTSGNPREWKRVGDATVTDLMYAARERREQAGRTIAKAREYERLAELLGKHGVEHVRELPASVLAGLGGAAA